MASATELGPDYLKYTKYKKKYLDLKKGTAGGNGRFYKLGFCNFGTFVSGKGKPTGSKPKKFPEEIEFENLLRPGHNYFQIYIPCKLKNAHEYVVPGRPFYITNDAEDNLFYRVGPENSLTRIELAYEVLNWLVARNIYYSIDHARKKNEDVDIGGIGEYASNLAVHGLKLDNRKRKGRPVYNIELSS